MNASRLILGVCLLGMTSVWVAAQKHAAPPRQTHFSAEDESLPNPIPVPADVLTVLGKEKPVKDALQDQKPDSNPPASWFSATEVYLSGGAQPELLVRAEPPLAGSNVDYFWIFRKTGSGHELLLGAPAHDLETQTHRSHGYQDIELAAMTSRDIHRVVYRFDGKRYAVYRETSEPIK